ncbi:MAG TPA: HEPN domain-containing protein [Phycisphaerae bacterium]|nr:HEPN domain-containing protein [Phycisphaerae bacterium]
MDESVKELVREWLTRANRDLQAAQILASADKPLLDIAIYHCQQAAEKSIKAWLQSNDMPFSKTHDIEDLVEQALKIKPGFEKWIKAGAALTPYVAAFRYPGGSDEPMPTRKEFNEALQYAQAIYEYVLNLLPNEIRP